MSWNGAVPLTILLSSLLPGLAIFFLGEERHRTRTVLNLSGAVVKVALIGAMLIGLYQAERAFTFRLPLLPGIDFLLNIDALAMLFVSLSGGLWLLTTVYAIGYLEESPNRSRFFGFFSVCVSATVGIAMAGNLFTLFLFYELLTLSTYPLVVHRGTPAVLNAGRLYLTYTLGGGATVLGAVVWLQALVGPVEFIETGGALVGRTAGLDPRALTAIGALLLAGFAVKAAVVPLHGWLPRAMVAPAPVSALLHAVAVVKAGAFAIVRVVHDVFGAEMARDLGLTTPLAAAAATTIILGSLWALRQTDLKRRLAYSTVSQVSYIVLGTALAGPVALVGGLVHLVHQGLMKITLFFCAGNLAETLGIHDIRELRGVGRRMPWTMAAFTVAALGMMAAPPLAGFVSEVHLGLGAIEAGHPWAVPVLIVSALLNAAYFLPIVYAAWFRPPAARWPQERVLSPRLETRASLLFPPLITAAFTIFAGVLAGSIVSPLEWAQLVVDREFPP